jgi:pimeloyl-ACP methyl ester carboxylesterase
VLIEGSSVAANAMIDRLFAPQTSSDLREHWRKIMTGIAPEAIAAALFAMAGRGGYLDLLDTIFCPTLIVVGEQDQITPATDAQLMQREIFASELEIIPSAGHLSPLEQPRDLAKRIVDFLDRHSLRRESAVGGLAIE